MPGGRPGGVPAVDILKASSSQNMTEYLEEHPASARRVQEEMKDLSMLSGGASTEKTTTGGETSEGFKLSELSAAHSSAEDAWVVVDGEVFDITPLLQVMADPAKQHEIPGGMGPKLYQMMIDAAGTDATELIDAASQVAGKNLRQDVKAMSEEMGMSRGVALDEAGSPIESTPVPEIDPSPQGKAKAAAAVAMAVTLNKCKWIKDLDAEYLGVGSWYTANSKYDEYLFSIYYEASYRTTMDATTWTKEELPAWAVESLCSLPSLAYDTAVGTTAATQYVAGQALPWAVAGYESSASLVHAVKENAPALSYSAYQVGGEVLQSWYSSYKAGLLQQALAKSSSAVASPKGTMTS